MSEWRFIGSELCTASYNMAVDEAIAITVRKGASPTTLRLYGWEQPSVSLGSFQKISDIDLRYCITKNLPVVRRPTGGRGILHGDELTYSFSSKNEGSFSGGLLDSYRQLSRAFKSALDMLGLEITMKMEREQGRNLTRSALCFKSTSYGEISFKRKKLIGSAQKRWKDGLLQQGSIPYTINEEDTKKIFNLDPSTDLKSSMVGLKELVPDLSPEQFKKVIMVAFEEAFQITFIPSSLSQEEAHLAHELDAQRYLSREWTFQR